MTKTEQVTKARHNTGFFALLRAPLHVRRTSAPSPAPRFLTGLVSVCALIGASLALSAAPTLAAETPETPTLTVEQPVPSTSATLHGVLSPNSLPAEGGVYKFLYKAGTECKGGSETTAGLSLGLEDEAVSEPLPGLEANKQYTVCLLDENDGGNKAASVPITFTTARLRKPPKKSKRPRSDPPRRRWKASSTQATQAIPAPTNSSTKPIRAQNAKTKAGHPNRRARPRGMRLNMSLLCLWAV